LTSQPCGRAFGLSHLWQVEPGCAADWVSPVDRGTIARFHEHPNDWRDFLADSVPTTATFPPARRTGSPTRNSSAKMRFGG
jgi:hypothetical protein